MGSHKAVGNTQVVQYVAAEQPNLEPLPAPAVAKTISRDTESMKLAQRRERQMHEGIAGTYAELSRQQQSGTTLGGS